jgi:hypothetical protein
MSTETFDHLMSFGIASAQIPTRKVQLCLATQAQLELVSPVLHEAKPVAPSLAETRDPDLGKVNYTEAVRGEVWSVWQPVVEAPEHTPAVQLLERLDSAWKTAEQKIGATVREKATAIFVERAQSKAQILAAEAVRLATEQGLPATVQWLESLKQECTESRRRNGREFSTYSGRKQRQSDDLHQRKETWIALLNSDTEEMNETTRRFLLLAAGMLLTGCLLWFLNIAATSIAGLAAGVICTFLVWHTARPLLRRLRLSKRITNEATQLASAYRAASLASLDEMVKRLEMEYPETLHQHIERLRSAYRRRLSLVETRHQDLTVRRETIQSTLLEAPPTIRLLLRDEAIDAWYRQGKVRLSLTDWNHRLATLEQDPDWETMDSEAQQAFAFLKQVRAEEELYRLYPTPEARMEFLRGLRDAAIGPTPGEGLLALDFAATAANPPQVHLLVEIEEPQTSELAQEILSEWAGAGVGVTIDRSSDPSVISLIGLVYGYTMAAQKGWENINAAFYQVREIEGPGIYPVLFPETTSERETL